MLTVWTILGALVAGVLALFGFGAKAKKAGVDEQKAKEAEANAKVLDDVRKAADAAGAVRPDDSLSDDPHNRDNWRG